MKQENTHGTIVAYYRIFMVILLLLALGGSTFALAYAWSVHETPKRVLALLVAIAIPTPWIGAIRMNNQVLKAQRRVGENLNDLQEMIIIVNQMSLSMLFPTYALIDVLTWNLFPFGR